MSALNVIVLSGSRQEKVSLPLISGKEDLTVDSSEHQKTGYTLETYIPVNWKYGRNDGIVQGLTSQVDF